MLNKDEMAEKQRWAAREAFAKVTVLTAAAGDALDAALAAWEDAKWQLNGASMPPMQQRLLFSADHKLWQYLPNEPTEEARGKRIKT